jgi:PTH1 family peptidyl-tRNA hydrolase
VQLWVGLGNPGPQYALHRHNVGFMALDVIADMYGFPAPKKQFQGWFAEGRIGAEKILLLKPATFMNDSGRSIRAATDFYKLGIEDVTVFHDELDLAPMKMKVKRGGGTAGHNGLRSTDAHLGNEFRRVRIGIGHPGHKDLVLHWVLRDFEPDERDPKTGWVPKLLDALAEESALLVEGGAKGDERYMSRVAHLAPPPKPPTVETKA